MKFAIDVETTGLTWKARPYMLSMYDGKAGCVLDLRDLSQRDVAIQLLSLMTVAIGANTWFDLRMLVCAGLMTVRQVERLHVRDVLRDSYMDSGEWHSLKELALDKLGIEPTARDEVFEAMRELKPRCNKVYALTHGYQVFEVTAKYCLTDSIMAWRLAEVLTESDTRADKLTLMQTLYGIRVDTARAKEQAAALWKVARDISTAYGPCVTSPIKLASILGTPNANKKTLSQKADELSLAVLRYRETSKLAEMLDGIVTSQEAGRVHPILAWQCVTGRASCSKPNLQNLHNHPVEGVVMREVILADSDEEVLVSCDFSGIELVLYANATDSQKILHWLEIGEDVHNNLTELVFGGDAEHAFESVKRSANGKVSDEEVRRVLTELAGSVVATEAALKCKRSRNINKRLMFATIYGAQVEKVAEIVTIKVSEARALYRKLCHTLPELPKAKQFFMNYVARHGNVPNMCGRTVSCKKPHAGLNTLIQSSAADIMRKALVAVQEQLKRERMGRCILTVHDEALSSVRRGAENDAASMMAQTMTDAARSLVDFTIKASATIHGERWNLK